MSVKTRNATSQKFAIANIYSNIFSPRLKSALIALGLKCGGTLQERAERLFMTKGKTLAELNPALFAKTKPGSKDGKRAPEKMKEVAKIEANIYRFAELLAEVRNATVENVERKQVINKLVNNVEIGKLYNISTK